MAKNSKITKTTPCQQITFVCYCQKRQKLSKCYKNKNTKTKIQKNINHKKQKQNTKTQDKKIKNTKINYA